MSIYILKYIGFCIGSYLFWYSPYWFGITHDKKKATKVRWIGIGILIFFNFVQNYLLKALYYDFASIFGALLVNIFWPLGYYAAKFHGIRVILPFVFLIYGLVGAYYGMGNWVFSGFINNYPRIFSFFYPWYLTIVQTLVLKIIELLDCCKCCNCQKNDENEMKVIKDLTVNSNESDHDNSESKNKTCFEKWKRKILDAKNHYEKTAAINLWPAQYVYYLTGIIIVFSEAFRAASMIIVRENTVALSINVLTSIVTEVLSRNSIYGVIFTKCFGLELSISRVKRYIDAYLFNLIM